MDRVLEFLFALEPDLHVQAQTRAPADPTRRPDLIRLLDSYGPAAPGTMDPARLRAQLGL